jgi:hypothetical protein
MKKSIRDSFFYVPLQIESYLNNIQKVNVDKVKIKDEALENIINEFKFKINFSSKPFIMQLIQTGRMVFVNEPNLYLPAWLQVTTPGKVDRIVVNLFGKVKLKDFDGLNFAPREVYGLSQIGYFLAKFYEQESKVVNNQHILTNAMTVYMRIFFRVLDVLYSVDASANNGMVCRFLINKFFLIYLYDKQNNEQTDELAFRPIKNLDSLQRIKTAIGMEPPDMYDSLQNFINTLSLIIPNLKELDISSFARKTVLMYGEKSTLMLENLNYLLAIIGSSTIGAGYVKDYVMEVLLGKEAVEVYNNFINTTRPY